MNSISLPASTDATPLVCGTCGTSAKESAPGGGHGIKLLRCHRCKLVYYCNEDCQRKAWQLHRDVCNATEKARHEAKQVAYQLNRNQYEGIY